MIKEDYIKSKTSAKAEPAQRVKKILIGPKNNTIDFDRILYGEENLDLEVMKLTTLMIRNIPIKFT